MDIQLSREEYFKNEFPRRQCALEEGLKWDSRLILRVDDTTLSRCYRTYRVAKGEGRISDYWRTQLSFQLFHQGDLLRLHYKVIYSQPFQVQILFREYYRFCKFDEICRFNVQIRILTLLFNNKIYVIFSLLLLLLPPSSIIFRLRTKIVTKDNVEMSGR